jgi:hypothetical protein
LFLAISMLWFWVVVQASAAAARLMIPGGDNGVVITIKTLCRF